MAGIPKGPRNGPTLRQTSETSAEARLILVDADSREYRDSRAALVGTPCKNNRDVPAEITGIQETHRRRVPQFGGKPSATKAVEKIKIDQLRGLKPHFLFDQLRGS
jgi:hypothetical protein